MNFIVVETVAASMPGFIFMWSGPQEIIPLSCDMWSGPPLSGAPPVPDHTRTNITLYVLQSIA